MLAGLCLSSLDASAKYLVREHSLFVVVWARYLGQTLFVLPFAWRALGPGFWRTRRPRLQLARSLCLLVATTCFFAALRYLPLAEGSAVTYLSPVFVVILSGPLLGERPGIRRWIATFSGFIGILILARPGSAIFHPAAGLLLITALTNAMFFLLTRKLVDEPPQTTLFYSALVGSVGMTAILPWQIDFVVPAPRDALLLLPGIFAGLGHWLVVHAFQHAQPSLLTPFMYLQMVWATVYGYLLFDQLPDRWSAVGMLIILGSGLMLALQERVRAR